jgi:hypothetical protein
LSPAINLIRSGRIDAAIATKGNIAHPHAKAESVITIADVALVENIFFRVDVTEGGELATDVAAPEKDTLKRYCYTDTSSRLPTSSGTEVCPARHLAGSRRRRQPPLAPKIG